MTHERGHCSVRGRTEGMRACGGGEGGEYRAFYMRHRAKRCARRKNGGGMGLAVGRWQWADRSEMANVAVVWIRPSELIRENSDCAIQTAWRPHAPTYPPMNYARDAFISRLHYIVAARRQRDEVGCTSRHAGTQRIRRSAATCIAMASPLGAHHHNHLGSAPHGVHGRT